MGRLSQYLLLFIVLVFGVLGAGAAQADDAKTKTDVLWTTRPTRVVPGQEAQLPRLPSKRETSDYPELIYVPKSVRTPDSVTFRIRDEIYRFADIEAIPSQAICKDLTGRKWACGLRSRMNLRALLAGQQVACKILSKTEEGVSIVDCATSLGASLAEDLLRSGSVVAIDPVRTDLQSASAFGIETRAGIWSDEDYRNTHLDHEATQ